MSVCRIVIILSFSTETEFCYRFVRVCCVRKVIWGHFVRCEKECIDRTIVGDTSKHQNSRIASKRRFSRISYKLIVLLRFFSFSFSLSSLLLCNSTHTRCTVKPKPVAVRGQQHLRCDFDGFLNLHISKTKFHSNGVCEPIWKRETQMLTFDTPKSNQREERAQRRTRKSRRFQVDDCVYCASYYQLHFTFVEWKMRIYTFVDVIHLFCSQNESLRLSFSFAPPKWNQVNCPRNDPSNVDSHQSKSDVNLHWFVCGEKKTFSFVYWMQQELVGPLHLHSVDIFTVDDAFDSFFHAKLAIYFATITCRLLRMAD